MIWLIFFGAVIVASYLTGRQSEYFSWRKALLAFVAAFVVAGGVMLAKRALLPAATPVPSVDLRTATYTVGGAATTLTGQTAYFGNRATGDLNGDGVADTAFLITQQPGGSGTFYYVAVALGTSGGWVGTNAILLGDRIAPQTTQIDKGIITVTYADRRSNEPFTTQPSVGKTAYFRVENGKLIEVSPPNQ